MRYLLVTTTIIAGLAYTSSALAQTCTAAPSCEEMGYTQSASDCTGKISLRCPFDLSAYLCGAVGSCDFSDYPLSSCPTSGNCTNTTCDGTTKYKLNSCNSGYTMSGNACCDFSGYPLTSCPEGGICTHKTCGETTKYYLLSCKSGYTKSGNTCVSACSEYYECGGDWQYCTGTTCPTDSSLCSEYCDDDYFPNECGNEEDCDGVWRNGWCSGDCGGSSTIEYCSFDREAYCVDGCDQYDQYGSCCRCNYDSACDDESPYGTAFGLTYEGAELFLEDEEAVFDARCYIEGCDADGTYGIYCYY